MPPATSATRAMANQRGCPLAVNQRQGRSRRKAISAALMKRAGSGAKEMQGQAQHHQVENQQRQG